MRYEVVIDDRADRSEPLVSPRNLGPLIGTYDWPESVREMPPERHGLERFLAAWDEVLEEVAR